MFLTLLNIGAVPAYEALYKARAKNPGNKSKIYLPLYSPHIPSLPRLLSTTMTTPVRSSTP